MAYMLAAKAHEGQLRKDGSSQLSHCVLVALQTAELGLDAEAVAAGLLHEALRSNPNFRSQLEEFMPTSVINLVDRVTTIRLVLLAAGWAQQKRAAAQSGTVCDTGTVLTRVCTRLCCDRSEISQLYRSNKDALGEERMRRSE